jgi:hypothetical protein
VGIPVGNNGLRGDCAWEVRTAQDPEYADIACAIGEFGAFILVPGSTAIYGLCDTFNRVIARSSSVTEWSSPILRPDPCGIQVLLRNAGAKEYNQVEAKK